MILLIACHECEGHKLLEAVTFVGEPTYFGQAKIRLEVLAHDRLVRLMAEGAVLAHRAVITLQALR